MRSHGLVFAVLLALTLLLIPASTPPWLSAGSDGVYHVRANVSGKNQRLYKDALALDAAGHTRELRVSVSDNELAIHVPKDYLAGAVFPVVVDPLVGNFETLSPAGGLWRIPGVHLAWNAKDK